MTSSLLLMTFMKREIMKRFDSNCVGTALETLAVSQVHRALIAQRFPLDRVSFFVNIDYKMSDFAKHKHDVRLQSNGVRGEVSLSINGSFLHQNPKVFLNDCIPHQLAHMLNELECVKGAAQPDKTHGCDWQRWLLKLNDKASIQTSFDAEFDTRAIAIFKGGIAVACDCKGMTGFRALSNSGLNRNRLREKYFSCEGCNAHFNMVDHAAYPDQLGNQINFIREIVKLQCGSGKPSVNSEAT